MKFVESLRRIPAPGLGTGCHQFLLVCANLAVKEGLSEDEAVRQIKENVPQGSRIVSEKEVRDTVRKAISDKMLGGHHKVRPVHGRDIRSLRMSTRTMLDKILLPRRVELEEFFHVSPIVFDADDFTEQAVTALYHMYDPDDMIFVGDVRDNGSNQIWSRDTWIEALQEASPKDYPPHIIWNPLSGRHATATNGKQSLRCDRSVAKFKYTVVEFDGIDIDTQLRFWGGSNLPVVALVYSGAKSIHGIIKVSNIDNLDDWRSQVQSTLFQRWLAPLGVDRACSNASRLSRFPGAFRRSGDAYQRLLYLNPNGSKLKLEMVP